MKPPVTLLLSDPHLNHNNIATYCDRPANFTELILKNWRQMARPQDTTICLGDVAIGNQKAVKDMLAGIPGRKVLIRGNHDMQHSAMWWMSSGGFDFACDAMIYRGMWLTHKPAKSLPEGCVYNIHGHLHNIWHGFRPDDGSKPEKLFNPWQRLFAIEYTKYAPVEFDEFVAKPDKYMARGLNAKTNSIG